ncbi:hypothetical protein GCM10010329_23080 [Streptomyces spiroverticillatus]|uniref:Uncharacterized protein n=1 Tax=Streptomyces finlayi TaxID=67296 RepID=A0A919C975_9ACTN|nr:DUF6274 family protein [Streptomyces finlayi]GHA00554.1 hypothetical protein GCM10010329_23080 [Streptomyces spiroverticillatus]GHC85056.1 hypothetical protein GCM10010334_15500 [Streptomyces finlayi]
MAASTEKHETRALLRAHLAAATSYRHRTGSCPICLRLLRLALAEQIVEEYGEEHPVEHPAEHPVEPEAEHEAEHEATRDESPPIP